MEIKRVSIALPKDLWVKLRRLQEEKKVKNVQEACVLGVKKLVNSFEDKKGAS